jgi:hypothetical protein
MGNKDGPRCSTAQSYPTGVDLANDVSPLVFDAMQLDVFIEPQLSETHGDILVEIEAMNSGGVTLRQAVKGKQCLFGHQIILVLHIWNMSRKSEVLNFGA